MFTVLILGCESKGNEAKRKRDKRLSHADLAALHNANTNANANQFSFGFDLRSSPQEDARQYLPFLKYLEKKTGYQFKLRFTPQDGKIVDNLGKGIVQFAAIGADTYIKAAEKYDVKMLVRGLNAEGKDKYRSIIIVSSDSPLRKLVDLKGKRLALGSINSTQGHLIPRILFFKNNINLSQFASYEYTGSHQKCADAVISARADACGLQDTMAEELASRHKVRILHRSDYYPSSGIAANKDVPKKILVKVKQAMLDFRPKGEDAPNLYNWDKTEMPNGFVAAQEADYILLREWLLKLGPLQTGPKHTGPGGSK